MKSPLLPWEVIERIIDHSGEYPGTPPSFSLTCRQLRPRSLSVMVGRRVTLKSRNDTFAFVDCLLAYPHLKLYVQSIDVDPSDFSPFPLLHILSNLCEIGFTSQKPVHALVMSSLTGFQQYASHISTLRLFHLSFPTPLVLDRVLLAFARVKHLVCMDVRVSGVDDIHAPLVELIRQRLSERLQLSTLTIDSESLTGDDDDASVHVGTLLFRPDLVPSKIERLTLIGVPRPDTFSHRPDWSRLRSLEMRCPSEPKSITDAAKLLDNFHGYSPESMEVSLELDLVMSLRDVTRDPSRGGGGSVYTGLERSLLRFTKPRIIWIIKEPLHVNRYSFWARELGERFPVLSGFGAFMLKFKIGDVWRTFTVRGEPIIVQDRPESPRLPWEIIERIIDHSGDYPGTPPSFSLTCRQLRPCALRLMIGRVDFRSKDQILHFRDFLQASPHLKRLIQSILVDPSHFAPFPLLRILPNLSEIGFTSQTKTFPGLHHFSVIYLRRYGTHISTLRLFHLSFPTYTPFLEMFSALPIRDLICTEVVIQAARGHEHVSQRVIGEALQLRTVTIDSQSLIGGDGNAPAHVGKVLFRQELGPSIVESLTLIGVPKPDTFSHRPDWVRLRSLALEFPFGTEFIADAVTKLLENFHGPVLEEVMLTFNVLSILDFTRDLSRRESPEYQQLEDALFRFSRPALVWMIAHPLRAERNSFWTQELGKYFPVLFNRGALTLKPSSIVIPAGHDGPLRALIISPNGKWVASASADSTIILWNTDGKINQRWASHGYQPVWSLAFSPDSRYLVSGCEDGKATIWDLSPGAREVAVLEGHASTVSSCAWSPDGGAIASGSLDGTVRLWDAYTFRQLHLFKPGSTEARYVAFSPNGRWLTAGFSPGDFCIWGVVSGRLHTFIHSQLSDDSDASSGTADFDPGSMRLAAAAGPPGAVQLWHVETGERLFILGQGGRVTDLSFSSDGKLVLVASEKGTLTIWDAYTGVELFVLKGHRQKVSKARFSPSGRYILSASEDRTVRLWRTSDGSCVATFSEHEYSVLHIVFSSDGKTFWSGADDGTIMIKPILPLDECLRYYLLASSVL